jgi:YjbR
MPTNAERLFASIAQSELSMPGVTAGTGFGRSEGLRISGKIFAMLVRGELVVKLPKDRVEELTASGMGHPFDPGHGRLMKEWVAVTPGASRRWRKLVEEAHAFVAVNAGAASPRGGRRPSSTRR